jgi:hypothetical protein
MNRFVMLFVLAACSSKDASPPPAPPPPTQSFHDAMALICGIPNLDVNAIADVTMRQAEINKWFKANVKNPEAIQWYLEIATVQPGDRRAYIKAGADKAGVEHCAYAARYNPMPVSVPVPK